MISCFYDAKIREVNKLKIVVENKQKNMQEKLTVEKNGLHYDFKICNSVEVPISYYVIHPANYLDRLTELSQLNCHK